MTTGRSEFIANGGHPVCLRDGDITSIRNDVADLKKRMFQDNGHESIQTSLAVGASRFKSIDERLVSLQARVTTLADVIRQQNTMTDGIAGESLTIDGLVRQVLKQMPQGTGGSSNVKWLSLMVICVCATLVFLKAW